MLGSTQNNHKPAIRVDDKIPQQDGAPQWYKKLVEKKKGSWIHQYFFIFDSCLLTQ